MIKMDNSKRIFGERLKQQRKRRKMTQEELANSLNMGVATVRNWEQGRTWPEMNELLRLCALFGCDADYLLGKIGQKTHDLDFLCAATGLTPAAIDRLAELRDGPFGYDDMQIVSKILTSQRLSDLIESVKDAKWAQDEVNGLLDDAFSKNAEEFERELAAEELPGKLRYLKAFRFEVTEAASGILNDAIGLDETVKRAQDGLARLTARKKRTMP